MSITVFLAVLFAAFLHATWNALLKGESDKIVGMAGLIIGCVPMAILALTIVPAPAVASYPYIAAGVLCHVGYELFLLNSYRIGDLTQVYPIARGSAPILVVIISVLALGVVLNHSQLIGIALIGCGILALGAMRQHDGKRNPNAVILALVTGMFIASYSIVDGYGARYSGSSVAYYSWIAIINAVLVVIYLVLRSPGTFRRLAGEGLRVTLIGGNVSYIAYIIVTWAFTKAPIPIVTALRETSIIFALLIGVVFLKERFGTNKLIATLVTVAGAILLKFG